MLPMRPSARRFNKLSRQSPRSLRPRPVVRRQKALPCLYIGRLSHHVTSHELRSLINDLGNVNSVTVLKHGGKPGPETLAMVAMATEGGTARVMACLDQRLRLVQKARPIIALGSTPGGEALESRFARWLRNPRISLS